MGQSLTSLSLCESLRFYFVRKDYESAVNDPQSLISDQHNDKRKSPDSLLKIFHESPFCIPVEEVLTIACSKGDKDVILLILENINGTKLTDNHFAELCMSGHFELFTFLYKRPDTKLCLKGLAKCVVWVSYTEHYHILYYLLGLVQSLKQEDDRDISRELDCALAMACHTLNHKSAELLLSNGARACGVDFHGVSALGHLVMAIKKLDESETTKRTNSIGLLMTLLAGKELNKTEVNDVYAFAKENKLDVIVVAMLSFVADPTLSLYDPCENYVELQNKLTLLQCVSLNLYEYVPLAFCRNTNTCRKSDHCHEIYDVILRASKLQRVEIVRALTEKSCLYEKPYTKEKYSFLSFVCRWDKEFEDVILQIVEMFFSKFPFPHSKIGKELVKEALHWCTRMEHIKILNYLLDLFKGFKDMIDFRDEYNNSPLMTACFFKKQESVALLLQYNAYVCCEALQRAKDCGNPTIYEMVSKKFLSQRK